MNLSIFFKINASKIVYRSRLRHRTFSNIYGYSKQVKGKISKARLILDMSIIVAEYIQPNIAQLKLGGSFKRSIETLVDIIQRN